MRILYPLALLLSLVSLTAPAKATDLAITTSSLPDGVEGAPYTATINASGGTQPYTWSGVALGCPTPPCGLPPGLTATFNSTGVSISGVPSHPGQYFVVYKVSDAGTPQQTAIRSFNLTIAPSSNTLRITTTSLPDGTVGQSYSASIEAAGGTTPYTWTQLALPCAVVLNCVVPPGLQVTLSATKVTITGTPTQTGVYLLGFNVTDSGTPKQSAMRTFNITIGPVTPNLTITTTSLPGGTVGASYTASVNATGGTLPYTWTSPGLACPTVFCGLPPGLTATFTSTSVEIAGTPTQAGQFIVVYSVSDSSTPKQTVSRTFTISIERAANSLEITTTSLPGGAVGESYSASIDARGGTTPYTWTQTPIECFAAPCGLPPGLRVTINGNSVSITGTPTGPPGQYIVGFKVTDSSTPPQSASRTFPILIAPSASTLTITTASLPSGVVGTAYSGTVAATGGTTPYTWAQITTIACPALAGVFCMLPPGLTLTFGNTVTIGGTPTQPGLYYVQFRVADSSSPQQTAMRILTISITAPGSCVFSISPASVNLGSGSGSVASLTGSFTLAATNCTNRDTWHAVSDTRRLRILRPTSGDGSVASQTIHFVMFTNSSTRQRVAHILISGIASGQPYMLTFTVTQDGSSEPLLPRAVRALYQSILGREPDQGGFDFWTGPGAPTANGFVLVNQMADSFYRSPEFQGTGFAALSIYQAATGQLPTFDQWATAVDQLRSDPTAAGQLTDSLSSSMSDGAFVQQAILNAFGRPASAGEMTGFTSQMGGGGMSRYGFLANTIFQSPEFQSRTNTAFVTMLYYTILERDPDSGGLQFWLGQVPNSAGTPGIYYVYLNPATEYAVKMAIIGEAAPPNPNLPGFLGSPEFQGLIQ